MKAGDTREPRWMHATSSAWKPSEEIAPLTASLNGRLTAVSFPYLLRVPASQLIVEQGELW